MMKIPLYIETAGPVNDMCSYQCMFLNSAFMECSLFGDLANEGYDGPFRHDRCLQINVLEKTSED